MKKEIVTKNVYDLAQERLRMIFNEFDNVYISFSGGKDSGVLLNLCIDYIRRNNLNIRLGVFHMDYEIQYKMTIDYVDRMLEANKDILDVYRVCVPFRVATCKMCIRDRYNIICRLFSEGYTSDIIYKILYPNLFSNKNIF